MTKEERTELLRMAIIEAGSIREGLKLFREIAAELDGIAEFHAEVLSRPQLIDKSSEEEIVLKRANKRWTPEELEVCSSMAKNHASFHEIGKAVGRSYDAIYHAWYQGFFEHPDKVRDNIKKTDTPLKVSNLPKK